ncbi:MAG: DUF1295 domain-containing protein [Verrucomicrobia bacterium]|nr:DUF1295 domain-containing protein [Verrucomicrobiota bacterium]
MLATLLLLMVLAGLLAGVVMCVTYGVCRKLDNFGIVDAVWAAGFTLIVALYFTWMARAFWNPVSGGFGRWNWPPAAMLCAMVTVWSLRLAGHLAVRIRAHHPGEDVRYARLRQEWGPDTNRRMFGFFQLQGALQVVLSLPFALVHLRFDAASSAGDWRPGWTELCGLGLWLAGLIGESLADRQLARFRADPARRGQVCQDGLWRYSRHPNYFFEWLIWLGYAVYALGSPLGWLAFLSPLLMWHFLVNVTGIPMTEELSVKSKGDAYREYQRTTHAFVPWFRRGA